MANPLPSTPPSTQVTLPLDSPSSTWDRIAGWVSENKAVAYTIAGAAVVVTGAGVVYLLNADSVSFAATSSLNNTFTMLHEIPDFQSFT